MCKKQCKGITNKYKQCKNTVITDSNNTDTDTEYFCHLHKQTNKKVFEKDKCPVCFEHDVEEILDCGHWVHKGCIIMSGKAECPICRSKVNLKKNEIKKLIIRKKELDRIQIEDDEQEIQNLLIQSFITSLYNPDDNSLGSFIYEILIQDGEDIIELDFVF
jgi:hypothetical protein